MNKSEIFYEQKQLNRWLETIKQYRKVNVNEADALYITNQFTTESIEPMPKDSEFNSFNMPYDYGDVDSYVWIKAVFSNVNVDQHYFGEFDFGTGSGGLTVGAETLLYVDGIEKSGVDLNHREIGLGNLKESQELVFRTWSGIADETRLEELDEIQGKRYAHKYHTISCLHIYELDEKINNLYYNLYAMLESYEALKESDRNNAQIIINDLAHIFLKYDEEDINCELLYKLDSELEQVIQDYPQTKLIKMIAVGQTHIDLAWLWRVKHTREKAARSFSTMLNLMDNNPEYTFFQSQPQLFSFLKEDYPNIYKRIQDYVSQGRIDVDGAMWLEADCNIPSGESLTRQILYGKLFIKDEFGTDSKVMWMPDVFGYSWAMPQILKKAGVDTFCTTKMQWNQYNRMPFNTFMWRGIDGSEITTHLIEDFSFFTINAKSMITGSENYKDKDISREVLYQYGFGDGGGGPRQDDIELVKRFNKIPGLPAIEYGSGSTYFEQLNEKIDNTESYVHTWDGELYLELHRGTFTSQAQIKKYNRMLEAKLRELEMRIVKAVQDDHDVYNLQSELTKIWKKLLLNQFHDIIPGSSIHDVNVDAVILYKEIVAELDEVENNLNKEYPASENSFSVFNSFNLPIDQTVNYKSDKNLEFYVDDCRLEQSFEDGIYKLVLNNLEPLAYTTIEFKEVEQGLQSSLCEEIVTDIDDITFSTKYYDVKFNSKAQITYLFDKELELNVVKAGKVLNKVASYEDKPLMWDAWDIDLFYKNRERELEAASSIKVIKKDQIETILDFKFTHLQSSITQRITLSNVTSQIKISHDVDWNNPHRLLRVQCETGIRATNGRFDIQYGNAERPTHRNTSWDFQKFEVLGHKWGDLSNASYGISLLNNCKYGYNCENDVLGLSLIKAAQFPDKTQDIGSHNYTYSIYVHPGNVLDSNIEEEAFKLNNELETLDIITNNEPILTLKDKNLAIDAIKIAETSNDFIIRLHEQKNQVTKIKIDKAYVELDLLENEIVSTNEAMPYEIKTLKVEK